LGMSEIRLLCNRCLGTLPSPFAVVFLNRYSESTIVIMGRNGDGKRVN
jgi:hypothetical protein